MQNKNLFIRLFFTIACILSSSQLLQANEKGNGGGAFICPAGELSEFLDLYEARRGSTDTVKGAIVYSPLNIIISNDPVETQVQRAFDKLKVSPPVYNAVLQTYNIVKSTKVTTLPPGMELAWPIDVGNTYIKAGCSAKGVIIFHDYDASMDVDLDSMKKLSNTDQAALWVHETIYKFLRTTQNHTNSVYSRLIVGHLFSDESQKEMTRAIEKLELYLGWDHAGFYEDRDGYPFLYVLDEVQHAGAVNVKLFYETNREKFDRGEQATSHPDCPASDTSGSFTQKLFQFAFQLPLKKTITQPLGHNPDDDYPEFNCQWNIKLTDVFGYSIKFNLIGGYEKSGEFPYIKVVMPGTRPSDSSGSIANQYSVWP